MSSSSPRRLSASRIMGRIFIIAASFALAALMAWHSRVPDVMGLGLIVDNLAPWMGLGIPFLLVLGIALGGRATYTALLAPILVWAFLFGPAMLPARAADPSKPLVVATQNVHQNAVASAQTLADSGAQVITLQELGEGQADEVTAVLAKSHPYHYTVSTVGIWSSHRLLNPEPLDLGLGWDRALRIDVQTEADTVRVYAVHAASARPTGHRERDTMLRSLAGYLAADDSPKIVAAGDFNAASTDRHFFPVAEELEEVHYSGWGLGLSWPTRPFPVLGIDHILVRGVQGQGLERLDAGDSDHFALRASIELASS